MSKYTDEYLRGLEKGMESSHGSWVGWFWRQLANGTLFFIAIQILKWYGIVITVGCGP